VEDWDSTSPDADVSAGMSMSDQTVKGKEGVRSTTDVVSEAAKYAGKEPARAGTMGIGQEPTVPAQAQTIPRPPKPRPLQNLTNAESSVNSQSWIKPIPGGEEAPNGKSVI
jgi:hypothetical protein